VSLGAGLVHITEDMGAASLVAHEGGKVRLGRSIINWEALDLALGTGTPLLGEETQRAMAWCLELAMSSYIHSFQPSIKRQMIMLP